MRANWQCKWQNDVECARIRGGRATAITIYIHGHKTRLADSNEMSVSCRCCVVFYFSNIRWITLCECVCACVRVKRRWRWGRGGGGGAHWLRISLSIPTVTWRPVVGFPISATKNYEVENVKSHSSVCACARVFRRFSERNTTQKSACSRTLSLATSTSGRSSARINWMRSNCCACAFKCIICSP